MTKQYFGLETQKAIKNFPFSFRRTPKEFIYAIVEIKKAAASAHFKAGELSKAKKDAILKACDEILAKKFDEQFVLPAFQGGAGTSNHMNVNEVIASRATELLQKSGKKIAVHPNDHVNLSHSTNDVMPSALKITAFQLAKNLLETLNSLIEIFQKKAKQFAKIPKLGRTHMQDAVPISLGDEFRAFSEYLKRDLGRFKQAALNLLELNLGGSAVGNSINASPKYLSLLYRELRKITNLPLGPTGNLMAQASSSADFVWLSQSLTVLCLDLSKIANDLRLLSSGPRGGFGEIILPTLQAGSSMMPGKVNPVLPEALNQLYFLVSGNNLSIEQAAHAAQLEMSAMLPIITDRLLESLKLANETIGVFALKCISGIKPNKKNLKTYLDKSFAYATFLTPILGYDAVATAVKEALQSGKTLREIIVDKKFLTYKEFDVLIKSKTK